MRFAAPTACPTATRARSWGEPCSACTGGRRREPEARAEGRFRVATLSWASTALQGARVGNDDLGAVGFLAEYRDRGARLATLHATACDDPASGEWLVRPQHVGELHV